MDRAEALLENARKQFATNGAVWDDRTEAAVRNLISSHLLEVEHLTMPLEIVIYVRRALDDTHAFNDDPEDGPPLAKALAWVDQRYDTETGEVLP